ncbi:MAG: N-acetyltransferase [Gemmatimonadetes bacterium]|nr:MAG: N-acetyltransferase [Gemmatimonadota bacterium]
MHVLLNPAKHPFHAHADVIYFLAFKGEHVAGRICAHVNHNHNAFHAEKTGFFGFFECLPDQAVADALLEAARQWLVDQGMERMRGPANFSTNEECALLVEGFDSPPVMMMPYNPPYYIELLEHYGLHKVMDLWAWYMTCEQKLPEKVVRIAEKIRQKEGITVRPLNMKDFGNEVKRIKDIYGSAWEKNWGFVPPTDAEIAHLANEFKPIVIPELALIAEVKGEAVAFSLTLPDGNQILKAANGKLYPFGIIKLLWAAKIQKKINQLRLLLLGIKEGYRKRGIDSILYVETFQNGTRLGYKGGEISWTLETNTLVNRAIELMGGRKYKTYRFYEKEI